MIRPLRNAAAGPIVAALVAGAPMSEGEAEAMVRHALRVERDGMATRITRRLHEARYYHRHREHGDRDELLISSRVAGIIAQEVRT